MRISSFSNPQNKNNFAGVYYSKMFLIPSEVRSCYFKENVFKFFKEENPSKLLKDIVENTTLFRDLGKNTDVFITTLFEESKNSSLKTGHFHAIFKNPQCNKGSVDEINLISAASCENSILKNLKQFIETLPKYSAITRAQSNTPMIVFEDKKTATIGNIMFNI